MTSDLVVDVHKSFGCAVFNKDTFLRGESQRDELAVDTVAVLGPFNSSDGLSWTGSSHRSGSSLI